MTRAAVRVRWYAATGTSLGAADLAELDAGEQARASSFAFAADRHRYQAAHVLLRRLLGQVTGTPPGELRFARERCPACGGPSGRPRLAGTGGPHFSLAHSGDAIVIAIAIEPVGVDCERLPPGCVCELMTEMGRDDADAIGALPEPERHAAIVRWWVRAEAVLKCTGQGIAHGLSAVPAASAGQQEPGLVAGCRLTPIGAPDGYAAAIAVAARGTAEARLTA